MYPHQSGFKQHISTIHLIKIETNICEAFINRQHLAAVCLDVEKVYDMVWEDRIFENFMIRIDCNIPNFIAEYLKDRIIQVKFKNVLPEK